MWRFNTIGDLVKMVKMVEWLSEQAQSEALESKLLYFRRLRKLRLYASPKLKEFREEHRSSQLTLKQIKRVKRVKICG